MNHDKIYLFKVNIQVNADKHIFSAKEIKNKIRAALDQIAPQFGYDYAEDSTRVLTIKLKDRNNSKVLHRYWDEMRSLYLKKKNNNADLHKRSRSIYAEAAHEICQKYGFIAKEPQ